MTSRRAGLRSDEPGAPDVVVLVEDVVLVGAGVDVVLVGPVVEARGDVVPDDAVDGAVEDRGDWAAAPGATSAVAIIKDSEAAMIRFTGPHTTHP
ncbi:hypothetical protein ACEE18_09860 [Corynebacterium freneyi]